MATSGYSTVTVTSWDDLKFSWWQNSQSYTNNTTTIGWKMELLSYSYGAFYTGSSSRSWSVTVNGTTYSGTNNVEIANNQTKTLASGTTTITHNNDGTKTFSYSFSQPINVTFSGNYIGTKSGSGSGTLEAIPRGSTMTIKGGSITMGTAAEVIIDAKLSGAKHDIYWWFAENGSGDPVISKVAANGSNVACSFTIPVNPNAYAVTDSNSRKVWTKIRTFNSSGTQVGNDSYSEWTIYVPNNSDTQPTVQVSASEAVSGIASKFGCYVQNKTKLNITLSNASAKYGASITDYWSWFDGASSGTNSTSYQSDIITGNTSIHARACDSRGFWTSGYGTTLNINVASYADPTATITNIIRCSDSSGNTADENGEYVKVLYSYSVSPVNNKNDCVARIEYTLNNGSTWTKVADLSTSSSVKYSETSSIVFKLSSDIESQVRLYVKDYFSTTTNAKTAPLAWSLLNFNSSGKGIAIGTISQDDTLDVAIPAKFKDVESSSLSTKTTYINGRLQSDWNNGMSFGYGAFNDGYNTAVYGSSVCIRTKKNDSEFYQWCFDGEDLTLPGSLYPISYGCFASNEIVYKAESSAIWFNYRTPSGGSTISNYHFGDGSGGYSEVKCKTLTQTSDKKVKNDIKPISKIKEFIMGLNPVSFVFKDGKRKHMGFIAQDVAELSKEIDMGDLSIYQASKIDKDNENKPDLYYDENTPDEELSWSLSYSEFIAPMVSMIQIQEKEIEELKKEVQCLKDDIKRLEEKEN